MTRLTMGKYNLLGKHDKLFGVMVFLLFVLRLRGTFATGYFEDADQSNDFLSSSPYHHFDLRHTIPGEPHIDYPIYSTVPRTSFACADRHEGYYADTETRCQAFRICTHTARSEQGFGFLCPNGTLFSQKNFVCDWYRNVNCEESELYYSKNNANRIGSKQDMLETVRQMMEYPMKTISKALQRTSSNSNRPTFSAFNTHNVGDDSAVSTRNAPMPNFSSGRKTAVTRAEVESVSKLGSDSLKESVDVAETQNSAKPFNQQNPVEEEFSIDLRSSQESFGSNETVPVDVYVNSLGELSTDPGVKFDKTQSRIIALGPQDREQKLNFAQTINVALNNLDDLSPTTAALAPDYVKRMRSTQEGTITNLANNINNLQQKLTVDHQVQNPPRKHAIRLLSRGFSAQEDNGKKTTAPYRYNRPKQTPNTIRFTPNALPSDSLKPPTYDDSKSELHKAINTLEATNEELLESFSFKTTTPKLQISKDRDYLAEAVSSASPDDGAYLSPPSLETPEVNDVTDFEPIRVFNGEEENFASSDSKKNTSAQVDNERAELLSPNQDLEINQEKIVVNEHAANLLLAGIKLSLLDEHPIINEQPAEEINPPKKPITAATIKQVAASREISPTVSTRTNTTEATLTTKVYRSSTTYATSAMSTSTETVTEISSIQKRKRNFRRFATVRRASIKPEIVAKRTYVRTVPRSIRATSRTTTTSAPTSTTTTTSRMSTTPIRNYQKRLGTNRLRFPRVTTERSTTAGTSTTRLPIIQTPATTVRYARHSDRETATYGYNPDSYSSNSSSSIVSGAATWESVRRNLQRFQINRNISAENSYDSTSETPKTRLTTTKVVRTNTTRAQSTSKPHSRMRNFNFKTQQTVAHSITPTRAAKPKTAKSRTTATITTNSPTIYSSQLQKQPNYMLPFTLPTTSITHSYPSSTLSLPSTVDLNFLSNSVQSPSDASLNFGQQSSSSVADTLSVSPTPASSDFLSFDTRKLTQSIVDNSILQNFHSNQLVSSQPINQYDSTMAASNIYGRRSLQSTGKEFSANQVRQFGYKKQAAKAPSELTPPPRPQYLPQTSAIPTIQSPRIVIARAEGQRIEPNSVQSIITNLIEQPGHGAKPSQTKTSYVPLKDFLTSKFGVDHKKNNIQHAATTATQSTQFRHEKSVTIIQQQPQQQQHQQQHQLHYQSSGNFNFQQKQPPIQHQTYQQQPIYQAQRTQYQQQQPPQHHFQQPQHQPRHQSQQQQPQYQQQPMRTHQQTQPLQQPAILSAAYIPPQEEQQQEIPFGLAVLNKIQTQHQQPQQTQNQPQLQQPFNRPNVFSNYQQHQEQLPRFPPLRNTQSQHQPQHQQQQSQSSNIVQRIGSVNLPLPTLPNGLLPSISAQRRSDDEFEQLDLRSDTSARTSAYNGASSYDVPINSIGRLPNDKTLLRQRHRHGHRH